MSPDTDGFAEKLQSDLDAAVAGARANAKVGVDTTELGAGVDEAKAKLAGLDGTEAEATAGLDKSGLDAGADEAKEKLAGIDATKAEATAGLDKADLDAKADEAKADLDELDGKKASPKLGLDDSEFKEKLAEDKTEANSLGSLLSEHPLIAGGIAGITAALPGIAGAATGLGALGAAGALAFGGIGSAVSDYSQATSQAGQGQAELASQQYSSAQQIISAEQSVSQARLQSAHDAVTSAETIQQAQESLTQTERDTAASQQQAIEQVTQAQQAQGTATYQLSQANYSLGQAYQSARNQITQLDDQLADSKLSVQSAQLAIQQAIYSQQQVDANAYSTSISRQQAALAVAQAQQQLKDAQDQETQSAQAANQANQAGVDGSQQVIQARQAQLQATQAVANANQSYKDAQSSLTRTELDNAQQVKSAQQQVAQAQQQAAWTQQQDAAQVTQAQQQLTAAIQEQKLQLAATAAQSGDTAAAFTAAMARMSPAGQAMTWQIISMQGALRQLEGEAQTAVAPGVTSFLQGVAYLMPEIQGAVAVMGQGIGNAFAQAGQAMQTSRVADELDGLIENGVRFDTTVLPGLERLGGALANAGSQKDAVDGLADGIAGIEDGLSGVVNATVPFEGALNTALGTVGDIADAAGRPLGTLIGVIAQGLQPALEGLDPIILAVGGDLTGILDAARPALTETGQLIKDLEPGLQAVTAVLTPALEGAFRVVGYALEPLDAFASSGFGRAVAAEAGFAITAFGGWKLATEKMGLGELIQGIRNGEAAWKGLAVGEKDAAAAGSFGWISSGAAKVRGITSDLGEATNAEKGMAVAGAALDGVSPWAWAAVGAAAVGGLVYVLTQGSDATASYIEGLAKADDAAGWNISGYQKLSSQLQATAGNAAEVNQLVGPGAGVAFRVAGTAAPQYTQVLSQLTQAQIKARDEADNMSGSLDSLQGKYGLTRDQAEQLSKAAGISAQTLADGGNAASTAMGKIEAYAQANLDSQGTVQGTSQDFSALANNVLSASDRTTGLDNAYNTLVGNFADSQTTQLQVQQDFLTLASNASQSGASMGGANQASVTMGDSFYQTTRDIQSHADAMVQDGDSAQQVRDYIAQATAKLQPFAKGNQEAEQEVKNLTGYVKGLSTQLEKMPKTESVGFKITGTGTWNVSEEPEPGLAGGNPDTKYFDVAGHASGGLIRGPGGPTEDRVPLLGSDGEFMVRAAAVNQYGVGLFEALNAQKLADGGVVGSYAGSLPGLASWTDREMGSTVLGIANSAGAAAMEGVGLARNVPGTVSSWIQQGMKIAGVSGSDWETGLTIIAMNESGGSQSVVNTTDANARAGTPSAGLMQFTDPTFARYAMPGYSEWMNPVDQVVADAWDRGYIESAYGSIDNVPGVAAVRQGRQYVGYDSGGWLTPSDTPVNKTGQPEAVLTPQESAAFVAVVKQMLSRQGSAGAAGERTPAVVNFYGPQMPGQEQMAEIMRQVSLAAGG